MMSCKSQSYMDAGDLHHRGICGAIILWSLTEALSHKTSLFFAFNNGTIWIELVGIAPSKIDSFSIQRKIRKEDWSSQKPCTLQDYQIRDTLLNVRHLHPVMLGLHNKTQVLFISQSFVPVVSENDDGQQQ